MAQNMFLYLKKNLYNIIILLIIAFGLYLRIGFYLSGGPLWWDEILFGYNIENRSFLQLFEKLDLVIVAPPLYMVFHKILQQMFGSSTYVYRLLPLISGCLSLFLFLPLTKKFFHNKIPIILSLTLFSLNPCLIYYSAELRPYSFDVLIFILTLLYFEKFQINNWKNIICFSLIIYILPFCSFSSIIAIAAVLLTKLTETKSENIIKIIYFIFVLIISILSIFLIYQGSYSLMTNKIIFGSGFLQLSLKSFYKINSNFIQYLGYSVPISFILFVSGIIYSLKNKINYSFLFLFCLLGCYLASVLHIYTFAERVILFLAPIFIIFISSNVNFNINFKQKLLLVPQALIIIILIISVKQGIIFNLKQLPHKRFSVLEKNVTIKEIRKYNLKEATTILSKYNDKTDEIISTLEFYIFLEYYNTFDKYNHKLKLYNGDYSFEELENTLKNKKHNYWILDTYNYPTYNADLNYKFEKIFNKVGVKYKKHICPFSNVYYVQNI